MKIICHQEGMLLEHFKPHTDDEYWDDDIIVEVDDQLYESYKASRTAFNASIEAINKATNWKR